MSTGDVASAACHTAKEHEEIMHGSQNDFGFRCDDGTILHPHEAFFRCCAIGCTELAAWLATTHGLKRLDVMKPVPDRTTHQARFDALQLCCYHGRLETAKVRSSFDAH
jgi:hypothetical protein